MTEREKQAEHMIRRMIAQARWEQHIYRCEMIRQKATGVVLALIILGLWYWLGELEYGLMFLPLLGIPLMIITTDENLERRY